MLSYSRFLTFTFIKKFSPWIVLAVGIAAYFSIAIIGINSANDAGTSAITSISTFDKFFPFLFAVLMSVFGIIHVFKDGEEDGSELVIISKPLTRFQIVLSKFLLIISLIIIYQLIMFLVYIMVAFLDDYASTSQRMDYATSLFLGGIVVQTIMTSVLILVGSLMSKVGTLVVGIIAAAAFPILSFSLAPTTNGQPFGIIGFENDRRTLDFSGQDGSMFSQNTDDIYFEPYPTFDANNDGTINERDSVFWNSVEDYTSNQSYKGISYIDFWYQWGRFYDMFLPQNSSNSAVVQQWVKVTKKIEADELSSITVGGSSYAIMLRNSPFGDGDKIDQPIVDKYISDFESWYVVPTNKTFFDQLSLFGRMQAITMINGTDAIVETDHQLSTVLYGNNHSSGNIIVAYNILENKNLFPSAQTLAEKTVLDTINDDKLSPFETIDMPLANLVQVGSDYQTLESKPWIPTYVVVTIWSILGIALVAGATYIYFRRDFK